MFDGPAVVHAREGAAQVEVGGGIMRFQVQGALELLKRGRVVFLVIFQQAKIDKGRGVGRL